MLRSLRNDVLAERRRADEAERDAKDERRLRSLAPAAGAARGGGSALDDDDGDDGGDAAALRRKLKLASSEIEALRTHAKDLRNQIQSGWWSWRPPAASETVTGGDGEGDGEGEWSEPASGSGGGGADEAGLLGGASSARAAAFAAEAALSKVGAAAAVGGGGSGCDDSSVSIEELDRLTSLLAERDAQVGVLTATVEALQTWPSLVVPSPRRRAGAAPMAVKAGGGRTGGGGVSSPRPRASRNGSPHMAAASTASPESFWADGFSGGGMEVDGGGGGVGVLNHVGAQGLARRCVALTARLTSALAREGRAERQADRLAAEAARRERRVGAAAAAEAELARRNRVLESGGKKAAAALNGLRAESAARLRDAAEEASKLR